MKTLRDVLSKACETYTDIVAAQGEALRLLNANPAIRDAEMHKIVSEGLRAMVFEQQYGGRRTAKRCTRGIDEIGVAAACLEASLLDQWVINGSPLGDWQGSDMAGFSEQAHDQATGCLKNAAFFDWLGARAGVRVIRDVIQPADAAKKWNEIEKSFAVANAATA